MVTKCLVLQLFILAKIRLAGGAKLYELDY